MKKFETQEIAYIGVFGALILFLSLVPAPYGQWGFIRFSSGIEFTIVHIPVIIGGIFGGRRSSILLGLIFGIGSISAAAIYGGPTAVFFLNPLVSILPRILFGWFVFEFYNFFTKVIKNKVVGTAVSAALATLAHSVMVIGILFIFYLGPEALLTVVETDQLKMLLLYLLMINVSVEVVLAVILAAPIAKRLLDYKEAN